MHELTPLMQVCSAMDPCAQNANPNEVEAHHLVFLKATAILTGSSVDETNAVVAGFIYQNGTALFARRALTKAIAPGLFHLPGGHIELGESPIDALCREIMEEFQVQIQVGELLHIFHYLESGLPTVGFVFSASLIDAQSELRFDFADTSEIVWASREELDTLFRDRTDHNHIAAVKGFAHSENK